MTTEEPVQPVLPSSLAGRLVRLEPLSLAHLNALQLSCGGPDSFEKVWQHLMDAHLFLEGGIERVVRTFLQRSADGTDMPFAILAPSPNGLQAVGITRFLELQWPHRNAEIGTLIGPGQQGSSVNLDSKQVMLSLAFEHFGWERVQFKVDERNARSMRAVQRLGAHIEGHMRHHLLMPDGHYRSSTLFSILKSEWPAVHRRVAAALAAKSTEPHADPSRA